MENLVEVTTIPVIVAIVYGMCAIYRHVVTSEKWIRLIPLWAVLLGAILGIVAFYVCPGIMPCSNVLSAILIGGASGGMATGINQIGKQWNKSDDNGKTDETSAK